MVNKLQEPKPNTTRYGKNSVKYLAAITWNKISDTLRTVPTIVIAHTDFLSPMLTNTGIFLRSLKLYGESRS